IKELIDKGAVGWKRIPSEHQPRHLLEQTTLEASAGPLDHQFPQPVRKAGGKFQREHPAEGYAQERRRFQTVPFQEFGQVGDEVFQAEASSQGEAIVLASKLVRDDPIIARQDSCEWAEEFKTAGQPWYQDQRGSLAPLAVLGRVVRQMYTARSPQPRPKL